MWERMGIRTLERMAISATISVHLATKHVFKMKLEWCPILILEMQIQMNCILFSSPFNISKQLTNVSSKMRFTKIVNLSN